MFIEHDEVTTGKKVYYDIMLFVWVRKGFDKIKQLVILAERIMENWMCLSPSRMETYLTIES